MQPLVIYHVYVNSGEFAGSEMYVKLSAMYIALVFWPIDECILLLPAATYVAGPAAGGPDHRCGIPRGFHYLKLGTYHQALGEGPTSSLL